MRTRFVSLSLSLQLISLLVATLPWAKLQSTFDGKTQTLAEPTGSELYSFLVPTIGFYLAATLIIALSGPRIGKFIAAFIALGLAIDSAALIFDRIQPDSISQFDKEQYALIANAHGATGLQIEFGSNLWIFLSANLLGVAINCWFLISKRGRPERAKAPKAKLSSAIDLWDSQRP